MSAIASIQAFQAADGSLHRKIEGVIEADARLALARWCKSHGIGDLEATSIIQLLKTHGYQIEPAIRALNETTRPDPSDTVMKEAAKDLRHLCLKLGINEQPEKVHQIPVGSGIKRLG